MSDIDAIATSPASLAALATRLGQGAERFGVIVAGRVAVDLDGDIVALRVLPIPAPFASGSVAILEARDARALGRLVIATADVAEVA